MCTRRSTLLRIGQFDERFRRAEDCDYVIRAGMAGAHFIAVDEPLLTQYATPHRPYKLKHLRLLEKYDLMLCEKYQSYLKERRFYWAAWLLALWRESYTQGDERIMTYCYYTIACLCAPRLLWRQIAKRVWRTGRA